LGLSFFLLFLDIVQRRFLDSDSPHLSLVETMNDDCTHAKLHIGTLQSGQSRNFLLQCAVPEEMTRNRSLFYQSFQCQLLYTPYPTNAMDRIAEVRLLSS
jgi:hypothetical protein